MYCKACTPGSDTHPSQAKALCSAFGRRKPLPPWVFFEEFFPLPTTPPVLFQALGGKKVETAWSRDVLSLP